MILAEAACGMNENSGTRNTSSNQHSLVFYYVRA